MLTSIALPILLAVVPASLAWVMAVQSRVSILETENKGLRELIEEKFDGLEALLAERHSANEKRLARIERSLNGHLQH